MAPLDFNAPTAEEAAEIRGARPRSPGVSAGRCSPSSASTGCRSRASAILVTGGAGHRQEPHLRPRPSPSCRGQRRRSGGSCRPSRRPKSRPREYRALAHQPTACRRASCAAAARPIPRTDERGHVSAASRWSTGPPPMGVNVQKEICDDGCSLRFSCGFQRQADDLREDPIGLFLMAHDYLWLPCPAPRPDLVIVDESVIAKATETVSFDPAADPRRRRSGQVRTTSTEAMYLRATRAPGPRRRDRASRPRAGLPARHERHRRAAEGLRRPSATRRKRSPPSTAP